MTPEEKSRTMTMTAGEKAEFVLSQSDPTSVADGRYEIIRLLGEGGQKRVYLARDTRLKRDVVVALLRAQQLSGSSAARLWHEAEALGKLGDHPNIVTVFDVGDEGGLPYTVSQYVEGGSVSDLMKSTGKLPLPLDRVLNIGLQLGRALAYTHGHGITHRDLKPANVWLTRDGTVKLGDFGLAVGLDFSRVTAEGILVGTVIYLAPEVALGQAAGPRSDLYSLGVMLYEMVTGRPPFMGDDLIAIVSQHINTPPVAPTWHNPTVPLPLESLILHLLAKLPEERPESAGQVGERLEEIAAASGRVQMSRLVDRDTKSLARLAGGVFVGREREMKQLHGALSDALSGKPRLVLIAGEPGLGKTRTTEQLATYASLRGAEVLVGRCFEGEGAPAFWLWVQIIRGYVQGRESEALASVMGSGASDIAQVVPDVAERIPGLPAPTPLEPEYARFRLFDSIGGFFRAASRSKPLLLILDDLHWADKPSLLLLEFLARELRDARILVVGTYRNVELGRQHPLGHTLGELTRLGLDRIVLQGLSETNVGHFIEMTAGSEPPKKLVAAVYRETEGNPFFVNEVVKLLASEGRLDRMDELSSLSIRIPEGVREVIGRRLDHLSEECNRILTIASVVGRDFRIEPLERLAELPGEALLEALDEAVAARVINEAPGAVGSYSFSHALIRETLYDELSTTRRVRLHRRISEVLENLYADSLEPHLAELAHHFFQASPGGDVNKAIDYAVKAAERASGLLAYEEAVDHYERALQALDLTEPVDEHRQCELLLALGYALTRAGNSDKARNVFKRAADNARKRSAWEQLADAALGVGGGAAMGTRYGRVDQLQVDLLEEAVNALGDADSTMRARLLAQQSLAVYHLCMDRRIGLAEAAVDLARRVDDKGALVAALYSRCISLEGFEKAEERLAIATELVRVAEEVGDREMALRAHYRRLRELLELGDIPAVDATIETYSRLARELRQPLHLWLEPFCRSTRALLTGRFEECERLAQEAVAMGRRAQDQNAVLFFNAQMAALRKLQGRYEELVAPGEEMVEKYPSIHAWRASLAQVYSKLGRRSEARMHYKPFAANSFSEVGRDGAWLPTIVGFAEVCAFLNDAHGASILYNLLLPFARRNFVLGNAAVFYGPIAHFLGLLATTMSRWEEAGEHFEHSLAMCARMGAPPFEAYTQCEYATMLLAKGKREDRTRALVLLDRALVAATELGMKKVVEDAVAAKSRIVAAES